MKAQYQPVAQRELGNFAVESGAIRFTDPCYDDSTWCKGSMPAANGTYNARIAYFRDSYDERNLLEHIDQLKFYADFHAKYDHAKYDESDYILAFESKVREARDHGKWGGFQKIDKLFELIAEEKDEEKRKALQEMAEWAVAWFEPRYKTKEYHYWEKDLWLLFELSSSFSNQVEAHFVGRSAWLTLHHIAAVQDDESLSKEECEEKLAKLDKQLEAARIELKEVMQQQIDKAQKVYDDGKPHRVLFLHIKHESVGEFTSPESDEWIENEAFNVGVDSGQAGFFDDGWYSNYAALEGTDKKKWDEIYSALCDLSSDGNSWRHKEGSPEKHIGGVFAHGVNSYTAHGDGSAPLFYRLNEQGEVIEAMYHYEPAYEEDEEESEEAAE